MTVFRGGGGGNVFEVSPDLVRITGPVTLSEIARWRDELSARLARGESLTLDLSEAGPWDVAGLQFLLSARASSERAVQPMRLRRVPTVLIHIAERSGLLGQLSL